MCGLGWKIVVVLVLFGLYRQAFAQDLSNLEDVKPVSLDGSVTIALTKYSVEGADRRRPATSWTFVGTPTLSFYGVNIPFTFILSDQESEFRQPFNQFGASPNYKWATLHVGYRSLNYSRYTLAGMTFLGAGLDLNPEPLRLSVMYGRFQRAVEEDLNDFSIIPAYERMGYAMKVGFGSEQNFIEAMYLHSKDDPASLKAQPTMLDIFPSENVVLGLNSRWQIAEQLAFEGEGAASLYSRDIRSPFVDSTEVPDALGSLIDVRSSTSLTFASNLGLVLSVPHFSLRLGYERIEPDFSSHGAYYFNTDISNYTLSPNFDFAGGKVRVSGSIGYQVDNLLNTKLAQTERLIGSGNVSWNPAQVFGVDFNYSNYSTQQAPITLDETLKNLRVRNVSQSASVTPRLLFLTESNSHSIVLSTSYQQFNDLNPVTATISDSKTSTASLSYNLSLYQSGLSLGSSLLYANSKQATTSTNLAGVTINASKSFFENKFNLGGSFGITENEVQPSNITSTTFNESLSASYRPYENGSFSFTLYATQNSSGIPGALDTNPFSEITATLSYTHNFSF
jgi:hypothetical protein